MTFAIAFLAGLATILSPCVLPLIPLIVGGALSRSKLGPLALCSGLSLSFSVLGVGAALASQAFGFDPTTIRIVGALVLIGFGAILLIPSADESFARLLGPLASKANQLSSNSGNGLAGTFLTGIALGAVWSPCAGPTLGAAIGLATQADTVGRGLVLMLIYSAAASLPLLAIGYGARGVFNRARDRLNAIATKVKPTFGGIAAFVGVAILLGWDKRLETAALNSLPGEWVNLITRF